ncbi:MAG: alpha/beta hydrolase [Planctomycetota bacterium]
MTTRRKLYNLVLLVVLVALLVLIRSTARKAVYHPYPDEGVPCPHGTEELVFASEDGTKLHGWLCRKPGATSAVLLAHGNAGNISNHSWLLTQIARVSSAHVLLFDYRGFGKSEGSPHEAGVAADARAALAALGKATGVPSARTVVFGHSLGGAVAVDLAFKTPDVAGLIVMSSFTSIADMARHATGMPLGFVVPETWDSATKIATIKCPKLIVHGDADHIVPFALGLQLFQVAAEPKHFLRIQGADHEPLDGALSEIARFIAKCTP